MLLYQFFYYWVSQRELQRGRSAWSARQSAFVCIVMVESFLLLSILFIYEIVAMSQGIVIHPDHRTKVQLMPYGLVIVFGLAYVNVKTLASKERVDHYKKIFDGWDSRHRRRWKVYVALVSILAFGVSVLLAHTVRQMLQQ